MGSFLIHRIANFLTSQLIQKYWPKTGKWGINQEVVFCVRCQARQPKFRRPRTLQQALWGGWTCTECGEKMDKYGKPLPLNRDQGIRGSD